MNSTVRVRYSAVTGNGTGLQIASSGKIISLGGNSVRGNTTNGSFTATEAQQIVADKRNRPAALGDGASAAPVRAASHKA